MEDIEIQLKEKLGEKNFKRAQLISHNKFGYKTNLIEKYYKSLLNGYLDINEEWSNDFVIEMLANRFNKVENKVLDPVVDEVGILTSKLGNLVRKLQQGNMSFYFFAMVAGILLFIIFILIV